MRVHWVLHELGLPHETRPIQSRTGETQTPEYLALNPAGKIPVLREDSRPLRAQPAVRIPQSKKLAVAATNASEVDP
ncbi:MAG: glutathione S-transferase N-terminal domain-containing protein [Candidatus Binatia bacterium]|nr:glutathione S-transferase N-terminal domain-containing protein [Candidatus Binatia bacterium]